MIFAFAEDGMVTVHHDEADAKREWEPIDVESRAVVFYDADGTWLEPHFVKPNKTSFFRLISNRGDYQLVRSPERPPEIDSIGVALDEAAGIEPNPSFSSLESLRQYLLAQRMGMRVDEVNGVRASQDPDAQVLDALVAAGANLNKPTHVLFYIYTPTADGARRIANAINDARLQTEVQPAALGAGWLCLAQGDLVPTLSAMQQYRRRFDQLAREEHGEYDGWEAAVAQ